MDKLPTNTAAAFIYVYRKVVCFESTTFDDIPVILPHMVSSQSPCPSQEFSDSLKFGRTTNPSPDQAILDENGRKTGDEERYSRTLKLIHTAPSHLTGRDSFTHTTYSSALCPLYVRSQTSTSKTIPNNLHLE